MDLCTYLLCKYRYIFTQMYILNVKKFYVISTKYMHTYKVNQEKIRRKKKSSQPVNPIESNFSLCWAGAFVDLAFAGWPGFEEWHGAFISRAQLGRTESEWGGSKSASSRTSIAAPESWLGQPGLSENWDQLTGNRSLEMHQGQLTGIGISLLTALLCFALP